MNKNFINCLCFASTLHLFSAFSVYGQQFDRHEDHAYVNPNISGVGSSTVVYHLNTPLKTDVLVELKNYLESMHAITQVEINGQDISIQFKEATSNQMIYPFIQRMEMLYIYRNPQSK